MISIFASDPVSPPAALSKDEAAAPDVSHHEQEEEKEEIVNLEHALVEKPIVGVEQAQKHDQSPHGANPLPSPPVMTQAEREKHNLTHQPPHRGCPICVSSRAPNLMHGPTHEHQRTIPLLVGDYCFMRSILDNLLRTCLVMRLYPYRKLCLTAVPATGLTQAF